MKLTFDNQALSLISRRFTQEIRLSAQGKTTSLPFISHQLAHKPLVTENQPFQVMKIGGSILQNAMVKKQGNKIVINDFEEERLPLFTSKKAFLAFVKSHLRKNTTVLAVNFAHALKPVFDNGRLDGILISGSKEHTFTGLIGEPIGANIEIFVKQKFNRSVIVSVANDTVFLTLSGLLDYPYNQLAGGVVGTGLNFAFFKNQHTLINLESAFFDKFTPSPTALTIDQKTANPHSELFEKEVAGGYLFQHYNLLIKNYPKIQSTHQLDKIARGLIKGDRDLAKTLLKKSAQMVACQIAGITNYQKKDMIFVMEGSLFWVGYQYLNTVKQTVKKLTPKYTVTFKNIPHCGIIGGASLVG